jgi:hypothetical protein
LRNSGFDVDYELFCVKSYSTSTVVTVIDPTDTNTSIAISAVGPGVAIAWPLTVLHKQQDSSLFQTAAQTSTSFTAGPTSSSPSALSTNGSTGSTSGLSMGAKAGIAVGSILTVIIAVGLVLFLLRQKWQKKLPKHQNQAVPRLPELEDAHKVELDAPEIWHRAELEGGETKLHASSTPTNEPGLHACELHRPPEELEAKEHERLPGSSDAEVAQLPSRTELLVTTSKFSTASSGFVSISSLLRTFVL